MRARHLGAAVAMGAVVAFGSLGHAQDAFQWNRAKKLAPKVGDKLEEHGTENFEISGDVGQANGQKWDVKYGFVREVKAVENGEVTAESVVVTEFVRHDYNQADYEHTGTFDWKGLPGAKVLSSGNVWAGAGGKTEPMGPKEKSWLEAKLNKREPEIQKLLEAVLPQGAIAADQKWTVTDLKKLSALAFSGVELSGDSEIVGSLTNVRVEDGVHMGQLKVANEGNHLFLAKDPITGDGWSEDPNERGRAWITVEGDVCLEGAVSFDAATRFSDLHVQVGYCGNTAKGHYARSEHSSSATYGPKK
jgi:hypothetical protein